MRTALVVLLWLNIVFMVLNLAIGIITPGFNTNFFVGLFNFCVVCFLGIVLKRTRQ